MIGHTPGPWGYQKFSDDMPHFDIGPLNEDGRVDLNTSIATTVSGYYPEAVAQAEANARVMAVTPELLAALKGLGTDYDGKPCFCEMAIGNPMVKGHSPQCLAARKAIRKTEAR